MIDIATPTDETAASGDEPAQRGGAAGLRVAMAMYGDVSFDSRVLREAETLADAGHLVTIYCIAGAAPSGAPFRVANVAPPRASIRPDGSSPFLHPGSTT